MKTREHQIIEKQKELIQNFKDWTKLMSIDDHEGARELSKIAAGIESELSALESEGEKEIETCKDCEYYNDGGWDNHCAGCYGYDKHVKVNRYEY